MPLIRVLHELDRLTVTWSLGHPAGLVWRHLIDPGKLPEWLGRPRAFSCRVGDAIHIDHGDGYICESIVRLVDPTGHRLDITWKFPDEQQTAVAVRIETGADGSTRLTLLHGGLSGLFESYEPGWITHLTYFEASLDGMPLPPGQFWHLYGTLSIRR